MIRHGATAWNAGRRFQGQTDVALSEEGRAQASALSARLAGERIDRIYSSDLTRALETARAVARPHGLPVTADARLREFAFGQWEGLTWDEIVATRPHLRGLGAAAAKHYAPDGGETFENVRARVESFLNDLLADPCGHAVIVTHAGPLHAAMAVLEAGEGYGSAGGGASFSAAGVTCVTMEDGRARLITLNDVRHLHPAG